MIEIATKMEVENGAKDVDGDGIELGNGLS